MSEKYYILKLDKIEPHFIVLRMFAIQRKLFVISQSESKNYHSVVIKTVDGKYFYELSKICIEKAPPELVVAARLRGEI